MKKQKIKFKEIITYIIFGVLTTVVNYIVYILFDRLLLSFVPDEIIRASVCNIIAWVFAVAFAFITNKLWVFNSKTWEAKLVIKELGTFVAARLLTGLVEWVLLPVLMKLGLNQTIFGITGAWAKLITSVFVIISNYVLSKFIIFRKKKADSGDASAEQGPENKEEQNEK